MNYNSVLFKGTRQGLEIHIKDNIELDEAKKDILKKIESGAQFFDSTTINIIFTGKALNSNEKSDLIEIISKKIDIGSVNFNSQLSTKGKSQDYFAGTDEGMTRFIKGTVRNGQRIFYEGNVVVLGDVNPGAEIIACGNVIVLGTLRGLAHAGATGNRDANIVCTRLQPTQIRIATLISRPPEDDMHPVYPEIVYIKDDTLVIEPLK
ncbi:MAG: septum site-determining protein MinC [Clostridiales bacterium]|nr:septum site-determining protein MinC [Clostridiales bacterium]